MKVSECCGAPPKEDYNSGMSYEDVGICSDCKEHAQYLDDEEDEL